MQNKINLLKRYCLWGITLSVVTPFSAVATKISFNEFCAQFVGQWTGDAAKVGEIPRKVTTTGLCSHDQRQLILSVSVGTRAPYSETWWFREQGEQVLLTYYDGISQEKQQVFSLYRKNGDYSLLGEGVVNARSALIQLYFQTQPSSSQHNAWQWTQNIQYLDDDVDRYQLFRGIEMTPVTPSQ
ncbi:MULTISPECIES: hypothetical protein [Shewanella]|jgi:hypothetical protein|uniref:hypothetical protein n=1 Tax=Shewanella TaxID=22 RepID=UPI00200555F6|nr:MULTISPECIES: hypothetical protein [Shewanella]MCA1898611.1 hypothetical protein [Shewanella putrefaciens]MCK7631460.1 hypothetical protein [Shewanella sp. JNE9-1]MCK7635569.1 hypothetical protein [Shewanella sp. JNE17]MCK7646744.1 hypothetical protein [Shewanella sp. JNE3-1]MCK7650795.1 hypothetical protein [Shewanella sp. JNE8]